MAEFGEDSDMNRKVYLPLLEDTNEYCCRSSASLNELAYEAMLSINPASRSQSLKMGYIANLMSEGAVSPCSLILGLLYIKRLSQVNPNYVSHVSSRDLFLTAMLIASKYMNDEGEDEALTNSQWAAAGYKEKQEVDRLERRFLSAIDWRLYVSMQEYYPFEANIHKRIAVSQLKQRGWATYTDLTTIWQASDVEETMLSASKQAAKVTCATSLVYLMCVATLFSASHSLHTTYITSGSDLATTPHHRMESSVMAINSTFHNEGACMMLGDQWRVNCTVPNALHQLCRSSRSINPIAHKPTWRSDASRQLNSGLGTYRSFDRRSLVDHQKEKEIRNGMGPHHSPGWNGMGPLHVSGWNGMGPRNSSRWNGTVCRTSPENNSNGRLGQSNKYVEITQEKLYATNNTTRYGSVGEMDAPKYHQFSAPLKPCMKGSQGGLNLGQNLSKHQHDRAKQYGYIEVKYNLHQAEIDTSAGNLPSYPMQQTTLQISTSPAGRRDAGGGSVDYLPRQEKGPLTLDRCALRSEVVLAEALPWLQTIQTPWLLA